MPPRSLASPLSNDVNPVYRNEDSPTFFNNYTGGREDVMSNDDVFSDGDNQLDEQEPLRYNSNMLELIQTINQE